MPIKNSKEVIYTPVLPTLQVSQNVFWEKVSKINDCNVYGKFVGQGVNIFEEKQAVMFEMLSSS